MNDPRERREQERRDALRSLDEMREGGEVIGTSQVADRAKRHFGGADAEPGDRVEIWGRRIGRTLSLLAVIALTIYLLVTYL